ncbi:hypothetical protein BDF19DRAFT_415504 [Syncephalis fuscata]|nr:hypothetical protein BDF19DRAFT_415504 [Syncephalis fuscata]
MQGKDSHLSLPSSSSDSTAPTTIVTMVQTDEPPSSPAVKTTSQIPLRFRMPSGDIIHRGIAIASTTVGQLKALLAIETIPANRMRLVRAGQALQDDTRTLESYNVSKNDTIYVVRGAQNETPAITPEALSRVDSQGDESMPGMPGDPMSGLMEAPFMKGLMSNSNFMREMLMNHPQMKKLAEENVEVAHMLRHPELFETMVASQKPQIMREMLRNNDRAISNIEAMPGGFNHLQQMYKGVQEPLMEAERPKNESTDAMNRAFAMRFNITPTTIQDIIDKDQPNSAALPNPWQAPQVPLMQRPRTISTRDITAPSFASSFRPRLTTQPTEQPRASRLPHRTQHPFAHFRPAQHHLDSDSNASNHPSMSFLQSILTSSRNVPSPTHATQETITAAARAPTAAVTSSSTTMARPSGSVVSSPVTVTQPSTRYIKQLEEMRLMGFTDDEKNTRALALTGGDMNGAIEWLINYGNSSGESTNASRSK